MCGDDGVNTCLEQCQACKEHLKLLLSVYWVAFRLLNKSSNKFALWKWEVLLNCNEYRVLRQFKGLAVIIIIILVLLAKVYFSSGWMMFN